MVDAAGRSYEMTNGGRLIVIKAAAQRLSPKLLVDTHQGAQARCERTPGRAPPRGSPRQRKSMPRNRLGRCWGQPAIAINANFFDVRRQRGGSWKVTGCSSPLGAYVDNTGELGRANVAVTGTVAYAGKQALSGGDEVDRDEHADPAGARAPYLVTPADDRGYDAASPVIGALIDKGTDSSRSPA